MDHAKGDQLRIQESLCMSDETFIDWRPIQSAGDA